MTLLGVRALETGFGANQVLHGVTFSLEEGRTGVLLGLNGAGKSVTLKTISGLVPTWRGNVVLDGKELAGLEPEDRIRSGLGHVLQSKAVFPDLTIAENLRLGGAMIRDKARNRANLEHILSIYPRLSERMKQLAGSLSGGEQAMLAVGRALMGSPRLLLVDEPSAGLSPKMIEELGVTLGAAKDSGTSLLLVEQNVGFGLSLADDVFVMEKGRVVYEGDARELDRDRIASLLGMGALLHKLEPDASVVDEVSSKRTRTAATKTPVKRAARSAPKKTASKKPATPAKRGPR